MTTTTETNQITLPAVRDERAGFQGELARLQATVAELTATVAAKDQMIRTLTTEQITAGDDTRLETFWEKAGRIADHANFCTEYDRLAEAMGGPRRERDYEVDVYVTITLRMTQDVRSTSDEDAQDAVHDLLSSDDIIEHVRANGLDDDDWEITSTEVL